MDFALLTAAPHVLLLVNSETQVSSAFYIVNSSALTATFITNCNLVNLVDWWNDVRDPGLKFAGVLMFAVS